LEIPEEKILSFTSVVAHEFGLKYIANDCLKKVVW